MTGKQRWGTQTRQGSPDGARDIILDAAQHCFEAKGINGTTMADIARQSSISRRTVYRYFPSKESVIQAIVDNQAADFFADMQQARPGDATNFCNLLVFYMSYAIQHGPAVPGHQLLLGTQNASSTRDYYFSSKSIYHSWAALLKEPFESARKNGEIGKDILLGELLDWIGRIIYSYTLMPAQNKDLDHLLQLFVVLGVQKRI